MKITEFENKKRIFTLVLLMRDESQVWVEELARKGFSRPHARAMLDMLEHHGFASSSWDIEDDAKGVRCYYRLTAKGLELATLISQIEKLLTK